MAARRILGIDPGLTRCGIGVVDIDATRRCTLAHVEVVRTPATAELQPRLGLIGVAVERVLDEYAPDAVAIERVFAEERTLNTVIGVAAVTGIVLREAHRRGIDATLHTPNEVKSAVSGYGNAEKPQVQRMVQRILRLDALPKPADAADALAVAICAGWRSPLGQLTPAQRTHGSGQQQAAPVGTPTPAQEAWLAAERAAKPHRRGLR